jgi:hypothetical protein
MRWASHVAHMGDEKCLQNFGRKNMKGRDHLERLGVYGKIILKWVLGKKGRKMWDWIHLAQDGGQ